MAVIVVVRNFSLNHKPLTMLIQTMLPELKIGNTKVAGIMDRDLIRKKDDP